MNNAPMNTQQNGGKLSFSQEINKPKWQQSILNTLSDPKRKDRFVTAIISAVAMNPALQECEHGSILTAGLIGETLNLSPSPQMGQYYMVPYKNRDTGISSASFQLGYKGYLQLALRSGQYRKMNVVEVKEGELISYNPFTEEIVVSAIEDPREREQSKTIGYYGFFELMNGFQKSVYWSRSTMEAYARKHTKSYGSFWGKYFDQMAKKTLIRILISKWGIMSSDMETAYLSEEQGTEHTVENVTGFATPNTQNNLNPPVNQVEYPQGNPVYQNQAPPVDVYPESTLTPPPEQMYPEPQVVSLDDI